MSDFLLFHQGVNIPSPPTHAKQILPPITGHLSSTFAEDELGGVRLGWNRLGSVMLCYAMLCYAMLLGYTRLG